MTLVTWACAPPTWRAMLPQKFSAATTRTLPPLSPDWAAPHPAARTARPASTAAATPSRFTPPTAMAIPSRSTVQTYHRMRISLIPILILILARVGAHGQSGVDPLRVREPADGRLQPRRRP